MIFYYFIITLCMTSIIHCGDKSNKLKSPERNARIKLEDKAKKERIQNKKIADKSDMKQSLHSLRGPSEEIDEDAIDRIMTSRS